MINCHAVLGKFQRKKVDLPKTVQERMKSRSRHIQTQLGSGLKKLNKPIPLEYKPQGSYQMKTMIRDSKNEYDIDLGVYFLKGQLQQNGTEFNGRTVRRMVCKALKMLISDLSVENEKNCVRVSYSKGFHIDLPIYGIVGKGKKRKFELASEKNWKQSDSRFISDWFEKARKSSKDQKQMLRIVRLLKKFAKGHQTGNQKNLSGFGITVLVVYCFVHSPNRDDISLYKTMQRIEKHLKDSYTIKNPISGNKAISSSKSHNRAKFFYNCIKSSLETLNPVYAGTCNKESARKRWDNVFKTDFFQKN